MSASSAGTALLVMLLRPSAVAGQPAPASSHSRAEIIAAARDVMQKARYCTLVTVGENGHPQARIVDPLAPDALFAIWIATNPLTRKVDQIRRDARVTLLYFDAATSSYVTVLGKAELVSDAAEKERHWKEELAPFYENRNHGKDYVLIRLTPIRLEIVSAARGLVGDATTWRPLILDFP